jgi:hypothetical protein
VELTVWPAWRRILSEVKEIDEHAPDVAPHLSEPPIIFR